MGWKSLRFVVLPTSHVETRQVRAVIPASSIIAYLDQKAEALKKGSSIADVPCIDADAATETPTLYSPQTIGHWSALVGLCQTLATRDTLRAAAIGREYVRIKIDTSVIRIRVSRTMDPTEVHQKQQMYYVSYEGEYDQGTRTINPPQVPHAFTAKDAPFSPSYVDVANFLQGNPYPQAPQHMRAALEGDANSGGSELRTSTVAGFLAEGARNVRALPINLMLLDMVQEAVPYTTGGGAARVFTLDRMFWKRSERRGTAGGYMPQSGAGGADVKKLKMIAPPWEPGPMPSPQWNYREGFQEHPASAALLPPLMIPRFAPRTFDQSRLALTPLAQNGLDKECGTVCMWLAYKFNLQAVEQFPDPVPDVRFPIVDDLNSLSLGPPQPAEEREVPQIRGVMRSLETIRGALDDRLLGLSNMLNHRIQLV